MRRPRGGARARVPLPTRAPLASQRRGCGSALASSRVPLPRPRAQLLRPPPLYRCAPWSRGTLRSRWRCATAQLRCTAPTVFRRTTCASARRPRCVATTWPPWATCAPPLAPLFHVFGALLTLFPPPPSSLPTHSRAPRSVRRSPLRRQHLSRNHVHERDGACPRSRLTQGGAQHASS